MTDQRRLIYQARQATYALLQRLYQDVPDQALLAWLAEERPFAAFPLALDAEEALQEVDCACQEESLEELQRDFRRLYVGPGPMKAPPWESVYRNEEHRLFDKHTMQVRETYAQHGMEFKLKNKMPDDYIAVELEFMKVLTDRLLQALDEGNAETERELLGAQQKFLQEHLLVWAWRFVKLSRAKAETAFYHGLAEVLESFLGWEKQVLDQILSNLPKSSALNTP